MFFISLFLLCKGSVFSLGRQEMRWFLLVLLNVKRLPKGISGMVFVQCLAVWHTKKGMNDSLSIP